MEEEILAVMNEIDDYGGVIKAIEEGYIQMRLAQRAKERKEKVDSGERVVVGVNRYSHEGEEAQFGEVFRLDPGNRRRILEKYQATRDRRDNDAAQAALRRLGIAALTDDENLMPLLIDCCHQYVTVGEMVAELKSHWGEFREPALIG
jgi:methylmalonyl-CoA mutase N-terminal domain/subunit